MPTTERRIGRYVLLEPVGRGAMGVVYRAEDPAIHRTVAVKVLDTPHGLTAQQIRVARERFIREGQAAGNIDHPNIIRVFDVGEDAESGEMYIVMEFVSGPSLERMLDEDALDPRRAAALVAQIASGLDAAHARGFIHRDIKPSNILLTDEGVAKIADFGITFVATSALTQDMRELGTPAYMSPEQVSGKILTTRADLFSLGVLAYEILAGRKPFEGADIVAIVHAIAHSEPIPITMANPELPQALDRVFDRMLAKEPNDRFASGKEFYEALLPCLSEDTAGPSTKPAAVGKKRPLAVWGIVAVALLAAAIVMLRPRGQPAAALPADTSSGTALALEPAEAAPPKVEAKVAHREPAPTKKPPARQPAKKVPTASSEPKAVATSSPHSKTARPESPPPVAQAAPVVVPAPTADLTISFAHRMRRGTLVVTLDGVPIFDEKFTKAKLALVQTTIWDPVRAPAGGHTLIVRVNGEDGKTYVSDPYTVEFQSGKGIDLRIGLKGETLTVKQSAS